MDITGYAIVTGGASGIGKACCLAFAKDGARGILVADLNLEGAQETAVEAEQVATNPDFRAEAIHADVTIPESLEAAIDHASRSFGRIDYGVHSAGITVGTFAPIAEASFVDFKHLLDVNINGAFLFNSLLSAAMKTQAPHHGGDRGSIVNLASVSSFKAWPSVVQYTTCKHAIVGLTKAAAVDNAPHNIRVNCVCPGWTDTPMMRRFTELAPMFELDYLKTIPMRRFGRPEETADAVIFLCSPRSSFTTGTSLTVDGGITCT